MFKYRDRSHQIEALIGEGKCSRIRDAGSQIPQTQVSHGLSHPQHIALQDINRIHARLRASVCDRYRKQFGTTYVKECARERPITSDTLKDKRELPLARIADRTEPCYRITGVPDHAHASSQHGPPPGPFFDRKPSAKPPGMP